MESDRPPHPAPPRRLSCAGSLLLLALLFALGAGWILYRLETWPARTAGQVRDAFVAIAGIQPRIDIRERTVLQQTDSILELAVASRQLEVERTAKSDWLGSTKSLRIRGGYTVRAGFDLRKPFTVRIVDHRVTVEVPSPQILSADQTNLEVLSSENGLWNKLQPGEVVEEARLLPGVARKKAIEAGLEKEALERFTEQLKEKLPAGMQLEVVVEAPILLKSRTD